MRSFSTALLCTDTDRGTKRAAGGGTDCGLGHFEGRGWRGFHHHASLCIAAYGFLVAQRLIKGAVKKRRNRQHTCLTPELRPTRRPSAQRHEPDSIATLRWMLACKRAISLSAMSQLRRVVLMSPFRGAGLSGDRSCRRARLDSRLISGGRALSRPSRLQTRDRAALGAFPGVVTVTIKPAFAPTADRVTKCVLFGLF